MHTICQGQKMPKKGYKITELHRKRLSEKAQLRGNNGWLGRKHTEEAKKKMRRTFSTEHKLRMSESALKRWAKGKPEWFIRPEPKVKPEPVPPLQYRDIFMPDNMFVADGDIWEVIE